MVKLFSKLCSGRRNICDYNSSIFLHIYMMIYKLSINWATKNISREICKSTFYDRFQKAVKPQVAPEINIWLHFVYNTILLKSQPLARQPRLISHRHYHLYLKIDILLWLSKYTWSYIYFCLSLYGKSNRYKAKLGVSLLSISHQFIYLSEKNAECKMCLREGTHLAVWLVCWKTELHIALRDMNGLQQLSGKRSMDLSLVDLGGIWIPELEPPEEGSKTSPHDGKTLACSYLLISMGRLTFPL